MVRYLALVAVAAVVALFVFGALRKVMGPEIVSLLSLAAIVAVIVVVVRNLGTNRKVADAPPEVRTQALTFAAEPGKAALYVLRKQFIGKAVGVNVLIDGRAVAQLKSPRFTRVLLTPGAHIVGGYTGTMKPPTDGLSVNAAAGEIITLLCEVEPGMIGSVVKFKPLTLDAARADFAKTRMVAPDVAEV